MATRVLRNAVIPAAIVATMIPWGVVAQDASAAPVPTLPPAQSIEEAGATRVTVTPFADWVVTAGGDAWVAVGEGVTQLAGADGAELVTLDVPGETCLAMDVGFDSVWVGSCRPSSPSLVRVDPVTASITATIPLDVSDLQFESSVAAGEEAVWVLSVGPGPQTLIKVDPERDEVVGGYAVGSGLSGVRAAYGGVWIARTNADAVLRIDSADGMIAAEIAVGGRPRFLAVGEGSVWAMNEADGTVSRIDPATDTVTATIIVTSRPVDGGDIAVGGGFVWARVSDQLVAQIDPARNEVVARYGPPAGSGSVAADDDAVWISAHDVNACGGCRCPSVAWIPALWLWGSVSRLSGSVTYVGNWLTDTPEIAERYAAE